MVVNRFLNDLIKFGIGQHIKEFNNVDFNDEIFQIEEFKNRIKFLYNKPELLHFSGKLENTSKDIYRSPKNAEFKNILISSYTHTNPFKMIDTAKEISKHELINLEENCEKDTRYLLAGSTNNQKVTFTLSDDLIHIEFIFEQTHNPINQVAFEFLTTLSELIVLLNYKVEEATEVYKSNDTSMIPDKFFEHRYVSNLVKQASIKDYSILIKDTLDLVEEIDRKISNSDSRIMQAIREINEYKELKRKELLYIKELEEDRENPPLVKEEEIDRFLKPLQHPLIDTYTITKEEDTVLKFKFKTKPIPITFFNMSPINYIRQTTGNEKIVDIYRLIYENTDKRVKALFYPVEGSFSYDFNSNRILMDTFSSSINTNYHQNGQPHVRYSCTGDFKNHLIDAKLEGNINKYIYTVMAYLQTITIGDAAGNEFYRRAVVAFNEEGEFNTWEDIIDYPHAFSERASTFQKLHKKLFQDETSN